MKLALSLSGFALLSIVAVVSLLLSFGAPHAFGSAPSGLQTDARNSTTTNYTITNSSQTLVATSTCTARTISTSASAVMLTFSDYAGQAPTGSFGILQPASTTVTYDSGQYGCGLVKGFSFASQLITVLETK